MIALRTIAAGVLAGAFLGLAMANGARSAAPGETLKDAAAFSAIADKHERSVALFSEAMKVIGHPRCVNCHPAGDRPTQGDDEHPHNPPVVRGPSDIGAAGLQCPACHMQRNTPVLGERIKSVPGDPQWHAAPIEMAWQGKTAAEICAQIKDKTRNGGRDLAQLHEHMATDHLVGWGWNPGAGRTPVPGTQKQFGDIIQAWIDTGAACPAN
ncbi:MAG: Isoquinoline 1-oxidoreductase subunit [Hyphomicrobiales bacterium]|nr:Isoquinoline 1-oxidoreductase subunit [Hyphomicrobiales bacterium]